LVNIEDAAVGGGLVLLGFFMNAAWEAFKDKREKNEVRERIKTNIQLELNDNLAKCRGFIRAASEGRLTGLASTISLSTRFWDLTVSNWPMLKLSRESADALTLLHLTAESLNEILRLRGQVQVITIGDQAEALAGLRDQIRTLSASYIESHEKWLDSFKSPNPKKRA